MKNKVQEYCKAIHFAGWFAIDAQGHGGGLVLMWKNEGGREIKGSCNHHIDFEVVYEQVVDSDIRGSMDAQNDIEDRNYGTCSVSWQKIPLNYGA